MRETAIAAVQAWEALDSRGRPTVACAVTLRDRAEGRIVVPSGMSTGSHEAVELRDGDTRYGGQGVRRAVSNVMTVLGPAVVGLDAMDRSTVDAVLEQADGEPDLSALGANAVLAVSVAVTVAAANSNRTPLWRMLSTAGPPLLPLPMINILSGGAHAGRTIDIQDILAIPLGAGSFAEALEWAWSVRSQAERELRRRALPWYLVADEGGLAARLGSNERALALVSDSIAATGLRPGIDVAIGVDVAASQFHGPGGYRLACEGRALDAAGLIAEIVGWCDRYPIASVEDPLAEDDWTAWQLLHERLAGRCQVLGDDLFATQLDRLRRGVADSLANAVLIKPNQAGTITRAERVLREAQASGYATVVSARSGDTEDSWLADLAVGWRSGQIKVGSTTRAERTAKWNRLLEIESRSQGTAEYAGASMVAGRPREHR
jgi:enolase